jgi:hypothetical protein
MKNLTPPLPRIQISPSDSGATREIIRQFCHDDFLVNLQHNWRTEIAAIAHEFHTQPEEVWKQLALHLPCCSRDEIEAAAHEGIPPSVKATVLNRLRTISASTSEFLVRSLAGEFLQGTWELRADEHVVNCDNGRHLAYHLDLVQKKVGEFIESSLHYLHSTNSDAKHRYGLFVEGAEWPFAYMSISTLDRQYKLDALRSALAFAVEPTHCMTISRIYGPGRLPQNTVSGFVKLVSKKLSALEYRYLVTAVNPLLGFSAGSTIAAGFRPYALCPVAYGYDELGAYVSRRNRPKQTARLQTPPNILFVRGLCKGASRLIGKMTDIVVVPSELHENIHKDTSLNGVSDQLRQDLERAWDRVTRYHRTHVGPDDPMSKGQCGVSSAYLASILTSRGYTVLFCEGDVYFPDGIEPITNHCWVKLPHFLAGNKEVTNLIIDLTADQSGGPEAVICETEELLTSRGIRYVVRHEVEPQTVQKGHLSERLHILSERLNHLTTTED